MKPNLYISSEFTYIHIITISQKSCIFFRIVAELIITSAQKQGFVVTRDVLLQQQWPAFQKRYHMYKPITV